MQQVNTMQTRTNFWIKLFKLLSVERMFVFSLSKFKVQFLNWILHTTISFIKIHRLHCKMHFGFLSFLHVLVRPWWFIQWFCGVVCSFGMKSCENKPKHTVLNSFLIKINTIKQTKLTRSLARYQIPTLKVPFYLVFCLWFDSYNSSYTYLNLHKSLCHLWYTFINLISFLFNVRTASTSPRTMENYIILH